MKRDTYSAQREPVKLLWTGGWDSTFRLLQLAIGEYRVIQPFYLTDPRRRSTSHEINAMRQIKNRLFSERPQLKKLILPTEFFEVSDVAQNALITEAYLRVLSRGHIGEQYDWLARWCAERGMYDIELSIQRDSHAFKAIERYIARISGSSAIFDERFHNTDEALLFKYFHFPLFDLSKIDMLHTAQSQGLMPYMEMTWFCHNPVRRATPCGICKPCIYAIEEGLGHRIPPLSRGKYHMQRFFVETVKSRAPFIHSLVRKAARTIGWA